MGLFESREFYSIASNELELQIRAAEDGKINAAGMEMIASRIDYAENAKLIQRVQAESLRNRLRIIREENAHLRLVREEYGEITDDFENPHERAKRFSSMKEVKETIEAKRGCSSERNTTENSSVSCHGMECPEERVLG